MTHVLTRMSGHVRIVSLSTTGEYRMYCVVRTSVRTGRKTCAAKSRTLPEWREPGHSRTGVGIDALLTWKTQAGAAKWAAQFPILADEIAVEVVS